MKKKEGRKEENPNEEDRDLKARMKRHPQEAAIVGVCREALK